MRIESFVRTLENKVDEKRNTYIQGPDHAVAPSFETIICAESNKREEKKEEEKRKKRDILRSLTTQG